MALVPLLLVSMVAILPHCRTESLVRFSSGLQVARGQSVFVTEQELQFNTDGVSDACKVEVVLNEPITQRVGKLTPQVFDCNFLPDEVKYVHNGNPMLEEDTVMLRVYRFTDSETFVEPLLLRVRVVEPQRSNMGLGSAPLVVPEFYGLSNAIDSSVLIIKTKPDVICTVRLLTSECNMPMMGQVVTEDPVKRDETSEPNSGPRRGRQTRVSCPGNKACSHNTREVSFLKTNCNDFLTSDLKYQHLSPPSPEIDYVPLRVELRDQTSRALLETESIWLPVLIQGATQNQPPHAAFMSMFILEVDQFILTPMSTAALDAEDDETPKTQLVFNVTRPPPEGYITHLDDHTKTAFSFTWQDLNEMKIAYQPPNSSHTGRRNYEVEFQATDSSFTTSLPIMVHISIRTTETNAPRVSWNMGLDILEGQSRPITWENLQIVDNDNINAVTLVAVDGPLHGRLSVQGGKGFMFKVRDLHEGNVVYHHGDSDTTRDHIVFRVTDGRHSIRHKFPIYILPKDDTPPFLINNVAFEVQEGGFVLVEEYMLLASDLDSSDDYILYQLITFPRAGELVKKSLSQEPGVPVRNFLQRDLFQGLIYYRHSGEEVFEDSFDFLLSDSHQPPNLSDRHTVVIHVFPVKDQLPVEATGTIRSITVKETEVIYITQSHLHFRDTEHPDTDLVYVITQPCFTNPGLPDAGRLFYTDSAKSMSKDTMVPVLKSFTQHAVNHHKVGYMPPIEDIGPETLFVQFVFSVSDQHGGTLSGLIFNITVTPVDNQCPELFTNLLRVEEGGGAFLTEEHVLVRDTDTAESQLRIQVRSGPRHGRLELQGHVLLEGSSFSLHDLKALRVRYIHDDSETMKDSIALTITDGINSAHGELFVQILPVNDEPPQLQSGLRGELTCEEGGRVQITAEYLFATDADSDDTRLTYMLARRPALGDLQRDGVTVDKFSQLDILQGLIFYLHSGGEIGPNPVLDTVTLIVSDGEAGTTDGCCQEDALPPPVPLHGTLPVYDLNVTVLPVNNKPPAVTTGDAFVADEGSSSCLCGGVLEATDPDTSQDQLLFHVEIPPQFGFLENTLPSPGFEKSNVGKHIVSFSQLHLSSGFINYVQAEHQGVEPKADHFTISVSDGVQKSTSVPFYIIINPTNDEIPTLHLNNFTVTEGGIKELGPALLDAVDLDAPPETLTLTVIVPPAHGTLLSGISGLQMSHHKGMGPELVQRGLPVHSFTLQDLRQGMKIMYMHDDTETLKDAFTVQLTDGKHIVQGTACVRILPVNDEKPSLLKNAGVEMDAMEKRVISSVVLEAEDLDTPNSQLYFVLNAGPKFGRLQVKREEGWQELGPGQNFTQDDVDMNRLWYTHTTHSGFKGHDRFHFFLSDTNSQTPSQSFFISVRTVHKGDIALITKPVTLMEGERVILTTDVLMASDSGSKSDELVYTVSVAPKHGHLHAIQHPGVPLLTFTQMDVAAHRVCYTHDNSPSADRDSFGFVVGNGATARSGTVTFTVEHSDRIPPTLNSNDGLRLPEGTVRTIAPDRLRLTDPDTATEKLTYAVVQPPLYGKLLLKGSPLPEPRFTQADVDNMDLAYQHLSGPSQIDRFTFLPTDGVNKGFLLYGQLKEEAETFAIQIDHLDRTPPSLISKGIPSTVEHLEVGKQGIYITSKELQASDPDSPDQELEFSIVRPPHFGYLENAITGGYIKGRFTQKDLDQRAVRFVIPVDMEVTADSFEFQVIDPAGNTMVPEKMELKWSRVELSASCYRVCENSGTLPVQVRRNGNSIDPAYVGIQVEEGTAKVGGDFTHSSASLIQFDPGVNVKVWNIYLKNDGLEENHEKFEVVLKSPKNAVLGQRDRATVEIIDPREGKCDPDDLMVEENERGPPVLRPPSTPTLRPHTVPEREPAPDPRTGDTWDSHPPRGDVPYHGHFPDYTEGEPRDQAFQNHGNRQLRVLGSNRHRVHLSGVEQMDKERVWTLHGLIPVRLEEEKLVGTEPRPRTHSSLEITPIWSWSHHASATTAGETPQGDAPPPAVRQHKSRKSTTIGCPPGWTHYRRKCFLLGPGTASWNSAEHACTQLGSHLASVHSKADMRWMWKFAANKPFWIGLTGFLGHRWSWTDSSPLTYSKLTMGEMSHRADTLVSTAICVLAENKKTWTAVICSSETEHTYICSAPAQTS